jgi:hypothetical protein
MPTVVIELSYQIKNLEAPGISGPCVSILFTLSQKLTVRVNVDKIALFRGKGV